MALHFYNKGSTFGVTVGEDEVYAFKRQWPASNLGRGPYFFEYDKRNGDLVRGGQVVDDSMKVWHPDMPKRRDAEKKALRIARVYACSLRRERSRFAGR